MSPRPSSMREALVAQTLEEVDQLVTRVEGLSEIIGTKAEALDRAAQRYKEAVTALNAQARADLSKYLAKAATNTVEEQRAALQEAARLAFRNEAAQRFDEVAARLEAVAPRTDSKSITRSFVMGACVVSVTASIVLTTLVVHWLR